MAPTLVHLPNGQNFSVSPVFGGVAFKSSELNNGRSVFPPGWTVVIHDEDDEDSVARSRSRSPQQGVGDPSPTARKQLVHRWKHPSLHNDYLFISTISNPSDSDFRPPTSPTRQIAMILWATLWWYFHQPEPDNKLVTQDCAKTQDAGKPRGEWKLNIKKQGIFKGKNVLAKLLRMGIITTEDSCAGVDDSLGKLAISRRGFWQLDARIFLFTLAPTPSSPFPASSPFSSRPSSPRRDGRDSPKPETPGAEMSKLGPLGTSFQSTFHSASHLPTYYPPYPLQYTFTNNVKHPIRPKPWKQGETFYIRYIPSVGQYLSFRVASLSAKAPSRHGPWSGHSPSGLPTLPMSPRHSLSDPIVSTMANLEVLPNDVELLHKWMNDPRVDYFWGEAGPQSHQENFLKHNLQSRNSYPVIGCWDGKPFGYFEIYWVKEDNLGKYITGGADDFDRGIHCLVGEQEFRGPQRVKVWLSSLVHYCWLADMRTNCVMMEPRVDNEKLLDYCTQVGFYKASEVSFPHKQSNLLKVRREAWEKPAI